MHRHDARARSRSTTPEKHDLREARVLWPRRTTSGAYRARQPLVRAATASAAASLPPPGLYEQTCIKCSRVHWAQRATSTRAPSCATCAYCQQAESLQAMLAAASTAPACKEPPPAQPPAAADVASTAVADERDADDVVVAAAPAESSTDEEHLNDPLVVLLDDDDLRDDLRPAEEAVADGESMISCSEGAQEFSDDPDVVDDPDRDGWTLVQHPTIGDWPGYEVISPEY